MKTVLFVTSQKMLQCMCAVVWLVVRTDYSSRLLLSSSWLLNIERLTIL